MKLLSLLKELSLHPKNAKELKGLILRLAVQGKLTANWRDENPDIETGKVLLEKLQAEKNILIANKVARTEKVSLNEIEDLSNSIPDSWAEDNLVELFYSIGSKVNQVKTKEYLEEGEFPIVDQGKAFVAGYSNLQRKVLSIGYPVVVFGDHTRHVKYVNFDFIIGADGTKILKPYPGIYPRFFYLQLKSYDLSNRGYGRHFKLLKQQKFSIPPLDEQKAIVEVVNKVLTEVEQLEELTKVRISLKEDFVTSALQRLTQTENTAKEWNFLQQHFPSFFAEKGNIKKIRETILQLAVQGKLTAQWRIENPSVESASELLKRIEAEKQRLIKEKKIRKEKPLPPIKKDDKPYELPEGWVWCRLGSITTIKGGKRLPKGEKLTREDTGRVYIRVTDMKNGTIDESDLHYVTEDVFNIISKYIIEKEDLYLTIVGATIGKLGLVPDKFHGMNLTENAARIIKYKVSKDFMYLTMISQFVQGQFLDKTNQVGVPKLALHRVAKTLFPLPPLEEQQAIVEKVNSLMALCDEIEQQIDNSQIQIEQLMQSCLREVFEERKELV